MAICTGPGKKPGTRCGRTADAKGLCFTHYRQQLRRGDGAPLTPIGLGADLEMIPGTNVRIPRAKVKALVGAARRRGQTPYELAQQLLERADYPALPDDAEALP